MKKLILVRHGSYIGHSEKENPLSEGGEREIRWLSEKLKLLVENEKVLIFASSAVRTERSAKIISDELEILFQVEEFLWEEGKHGGFDETLKLIEFNRDKFDVIIIVAHLDHTRDFQEVFIKMEFGIWLEPVEVSRSEAVVIDCEKKTTKLISYK